jgi:hypothetical protein
MNTTTETHYSGYTNQQTYNTALMYDEVFQDITITQLRRNRSSTVEDAHEDVAAAFESIVMELETSNLPTTGMTRDIVEMYLDAVDWMDLAETYVDMNKNLLEPLEAFEE